MFINRKLSFYAVFRTDDANAILSGKKDIKDAYCYTICNTLREASEYLIRIAVASKGEHYSNWCEFRNFNVQDQVAINQYYNDVVTDKNEYKILTIKYDRDKLAAILRVFNNCTPLGCSFNTKMEYIQFASQKVSQDNNTNE